MRGEYRLLCRHAIGRSAKIYEMGCDLLAELPDGRVKIHVYGDRYWPDNGQSRIRYVAKHRIKRADGA